MESLVDVNIAVYNHARYLRQTLDGVLAQETNFEFRLIIGDDCSTDGSIEILKEYEIKFPHKIFLILQQKNIGLDTTERNGIILLKKSTAKYIALLDGDDYWIDSKKLQKQVEFLENNPEFSAYCHNSYVEKNQKLIRTYNSINETRQMRGPEIVSSLSIPTSSLVFRNIFINASNEIYDSCTIDLSLFFWISRRGKFLYSKEIMSVYRLHDGGIWTGQDEFIKINKAIIINRRLVDQLPLNKDEKRAVVESILNLKHNRIKWHANRYQFGLEYFKDVLSLIGARFRGYPVRLKFLLFCIVPDSIVYRLRPDSKPHVGDISNAA